MSGIIFYAKLQKQRLETAARAKGCIESDLHGAKFKLHCQRVIRRHVGFALEFEQAMLRRCLERPEDAEEWANYDLAGAISRLTLARVERLAYAGRALP